MAFEAMCWGLWTVITCARRSGVSKSRLKRIVDAVWAEHAKRFSDSELE